MVEIFSTGKCLRVFEGHSGRVGEVDIGSLDQCRGGALSGSDDRNNPAVGHQYRK